MLTAKQISDNWDKFLENLVNCTSGERQAILLKFYKEREDDFATIPASSNLNHHGAFIGGYVNHVNNVFEMAFYTYKLWDKYENAFGFTKEELLFSAIHHDLGKFGTLDKVLYQPIEDAWKVKKGMYYEYNSDIEFMSIPDRSLFLLNQLGIVLTQNEFIAIKTHDGIYDEANKAYYMSSQAPRLRNNISYILHHADMLAARVEYFAQQNYVLPQNVETKTVDTSLRDKLNKL